MPRAYSEIDTNALTNLIDQKMHVLMTRLAESDTFLEQTNANIKQAEENLNTVQIKLQ